VDVFKKGMGGQRRDRHAPSRIKAEFGKREMSTIDRIRVYFQGKPSSPYTTMLYRQEYNDLNKHIQGKYRRRPTYK